MFDQLRELLAFKRPISHSAGKVVTVAEQPGFTDWIIAGQLRSQPFFEAPSAPKPILKDGLKSERIERERRQGRGRPGNGVVHMFHRADLSRIARPKPPRLRQIRTDSESTHGWLGYLIHLQQAFAPRNQRA